MKEEVAKVYRTTDYGLFKRLEGNRVVDHSDKVVVSIKSVGYVRSPILVNENYEVIDGQNRLMALEKLRMPVEYIIQDGIGLKECQALNIGQKNWSNEDWINSYAEKGFKPYIELKDAKAVHGSLDYRLLIVVATKCDAASAHKRIPDGTLEYHAPTYAEENILCFLEGVKPYVSASNFRTDNTMRLLAMLAVRGLIDCVRMAKQFKKYSQNDKFGAQSGGGRILEALQSLYNYNMKKCVYFADKYREMSGRRS